MPASRPLDRSAWEREMRRLRVIARLLATVLLALVIRALVSGINPAVGVAAAVIAALLALDLVLAHQGRQLEPTCRNERRG